MRTLLVCQDCIHTYITILYNLMTNTYETGEWTIHCMMHSSVILVFRLVNFNHINSLAKIGCYRHEAT